MCAHGRRPARPQPQPADWAGQTEVLCLPIADRRCADREGVGTEIRALSLLRDVAAVPDTVVLTAPIRLWQELPDRRPPDPFSEFGRLVEGPLSVRAWRLSPGLRDLPIGPVFNNLEGEPVAEAMLELLALAGLGGQPASQRVAFALQRFVPADASVHAHAAPGDLRVRLKAFLGLAERLTEPLHHDRIVLDAEDLAIREYRVADKPRATVGAAGGTRTASVSAQRRRAPVLSVEMVQQLGAQAVKAARRLAGPVTCEFAVVGLQALLVRCRPV